MRRLILEDVFSLDWEWIGAQSRGVHRQASNNEEKEILNSSDIPKAGFNSKKEGMKGPELWSGDVRLSQLKTARSIM